jgi:hypothetical protein
LAEAYAWLEHEQEGLGKEFAREVHDALRNLTAHPRRFPGYLQPVRRCIIERLYFYRFNHAHQPQPRLLAWPRDEKVTQVSGKSFCIGASLN